MFFVLIASLFFSPSVAKLIPPFVNHGLRSIYHHGNLSSIPTLSPSCKSSLLEIENAMSRNEMWTYSFPDSTASSPSGLLKGTVTDFGEYDNCLETKTPEAVALPFQGQYCMVEFMPIPNSLLHNMTLRVLPALGFFNLTLGFCVPSTCSTIDVKMILISDIVQNLELQLVNFNRVSCDTPASISWQHRLSHTTFGQKFCLSLLLVVIGEQLLFYILNLFGMDVSTLHPILKCLSLKRNFSHLFRIKKDKHNVSYIDFFRLFMIVMGISGHCLLCLETMVPMLVLRNMNNLREYFKSIHFQPVNEMGFDFFSVLGGFSLYTFITKVKVSPFRLFTEKYLRIIPITLCLISIEMMWPLLGDGPLYTRVGKEILTRCSSNWWKHIFLLGNESLEEQCVGHTFFTSSSFHLLILGMVCIRVIRQNWKVGISLTILLNSFIYIRLFSSLQGIRTPLLMSKDMTTPNGVDYLMRVHFPTYTHIPGYLSGIWTSYVLHQNWKPYGPSWKNTVIHFIIAEALVIVVFFSPSLHNIFGVVHEEIYPHFIVLFRVLFVLTAPLFLSIIPFSPIGVKNQESEIQARNNNDLDFSQIKEKWTTSIFHGLSRLSFSMHMINYFYIKYDFMTSRVLIDIAPYDFFKRLFYSIVYIVLLALVFHLFFVAPVNSFVDMIFKRRGKEGKKRE